MFDQSDLGVANRIMEEHLKTPEVNKNKDKFVKFAFIGLGQGGGRIAAEFSRYRFPTYLFNTSESDMAEHEKLIPRENRILTTSTQTKHNVEGTDKNADLGYTIASETENQRKYATVMMKPEVMDADFVWVTVSLGGGTGNGALPVVLNMLQKVRKKKRFTVDRVPFGVICSLPPKDEVGSKIRENAIKGIDELKRLISEGEIGSVIVIDNEKLNENFLSEELVNKATGDFIDAKSYANIMVSLAVVETAAIPLLKGRMVLDMAEYLGTISTPGWLSISKAKVSDVNGLDVVVKTMFEENEILATTTGEAVVNAAMAMLVPKTQHIPTNIQDNVLRYASTNYNVRNRGILTVPDLNETILYGMSVSLAPPIRAEELDEELKVLKELEKQELAKRSSFNKISENSGFTQMKSYGSTDEDSNTTLSLDDLISDSEKPVTPKKSETSERKLTLSLDDLIN